MEELLRWLPAANSGSPRPARHDVGIGGVRIRRGVPARLRRFPDLRLAVADDDERATHRAIHGLVERPVTW